MEERAEYGRMPLHTIRKEIPHRLGFMMGTVFERYINTKRVFFHWIGRCLSIDPCYLAVKSVAARICHRSPDLP